MFYGGRTLPTYMSAMNGRSPRTNHRTQPQENCLKVMVVSISVGASFVVFCVFIASAAAARSLKL